MMTEEERNTYQKLYEHLSTQSKYFETLEFEILAADYKAAANAIYKLAELDK